jgi:hypothetical protein
MDNGGLGIDVGGVYAPDGAGLAVGGDVSNSGVTFTVGAGFGGVGHGGTVTYTSVTPFCPIT